MPSNVSISKKIRDALIAEQFQTRSVFREMQLDIELRLDKLRKDILTAFQAEDPTAPPTQRGKDGAYLRFMARCAKLSTEAFSDLRKIQEQYAKQVADAQVEALFSTLVEEVQREME